MLLKKGTFYLSLAGITATAVMASRMSAPLPEMTPPIDPSPKPYASSVAASGIIEAMSDNVAIGVADPGLVIRVHVKVSEQVKQGQPLFSLDDRDLLAQLNVNLANARIAQATLKRLQDQLARLKSVSDPRAISQDEVRTRENDVLVAAAELDAAWAQVGQNRTRIERLTVIAPRDGTILQVNVRPGEYASATPKNPAMILGDVEHLQIRADVDEQNAPRLQSGQTATAYLKGDTTQPIELHFVRIEPYVVPKTSLTGASTERVDTRVLQVIYAFERPQDRPVYVGQQVDLFVNSDVPAVEARVTTTPPRQVALK